MSGTRQRPSIFGGGEDDLDLSGFSPKDGSDKPHVPLETLERISEETGLPSRAAKPKSGTHLQPLKRPVLTKSGRTVLLNARITQRAHSRFHEIVEVERARYERGEIMHRPTLGEVVELALAALERERQSAGK